MYEDKTIICKDCGEEFIFSAGEQEFYAEKGLANEPQRCKACRMARKTQADLQERDTLSFALTAVQRTAFLSLPWRARTTTAEHA